MEDYIIIYCTVPSEEVGKVIAEEIVNSRLAACVNMVNDITSIYRWKDNICRDFENLLIMKSRKTLFDKICAKIRENHPYEVPEIISVNIACGSDPYLSWIADNTLPS